VVELDIARFESLDGALLFHECLFALLERVFRVFSFALEFFELVLVAGVLVLESVAFLLQRPSSVVLFVELLLESVTALSENLL
jgi:hypothetical protein